MTVSVLAVLWNLQVRICDSNPLGARMRSYTVAIPVRKERSATTAPSRLSSSSELAECTSTEQSHPKSTRCQKMIFSPNCKLRGLPAPAI